MCCVRSSRAVLTSSVLCPQQQGCSHLCVLCPQQQGCSSAEGAASSDDEDEDLDAEDDFHYEMEEEPT